MKKFALSMVLSFVLASPAFAVTSPGDTTTDDLNCVTQPTCADLGYEAATALSTCANGSWLSCPFDSTFKKCVPNSSSEAEVDCDTLGFTTSDKTSWCKNIVKCPADASYTLCSSAITCASGETLIGGSCVTVYSSCSAAGLMSSSECNSTGWLCGLPQTIYTSSTGDTTICYRSKRAAPCPAGYATTSAGCGLSALTNETCSKGYTLLLQLNPSYYSGDTACGQCSCVLEPILPSSSSSSGGSTTDCCSLGYKYYVNGSCTNTCPYTDGRLCITCAIGQASPI